MQPMCDGAEDQWIGAGLRILRKSPFYYSCFLPDVGLFGVRLPGFISICQERKQRDIGRPVGDLCLGLFAGSL